MSENPPLLPNAVFCALQCIGAVAPYNCYYGFHGRRIGGFNELLGLQLTREWIMQRMDWSAENMFSVYFDSHITVSADSDWFSGHMRTVPIS